jgi:hypothetical protein
VSLHGHAFGSYAKTFCEMLLTTPRVKVSPAQVKVSLGLGLATGPPERFGVLAPVIDGARQHLEDRCAFPGAGVHACFAASLESSLADLLLADGETPWPPGLRWPRRPPSMSHAVTPSG